MKKLIIFVLTLFLTFTIILSTKSANAELTPVTPFYGGDILNGKEIYLFNSYSATPNFENGYIGKKTISEQDVYYQENSFYNGWYKNLGEDLIYDYIYPETTSDESFIFYIKFDNMLVQYLQLALISPEPMVNEYYIKFSGENAFNFMSTDGYNEYLITPPTNDMTKQVEWLAFDVGFPDYMASFRPLTAQTAYNFGFSSGEREGYNNGYNTGYSNGYNNGHTDGYNEGSIDTQYGVNTVVDFNQLINDEYKSITIPANTSSWVFVDDIPNIIGTHLYLLRWYQDVDIISTDRNTPTYIVNGGTRVYQSTQADRNLNKGYYYWFFYPNASGTLSISYWLHNTESSTYLYFNLFDLTQIYGSGNEPVDQYETFENDFPSNDYPYTTSDLINIDYENGYIKGQKLGYNLGYDDGKDAQATQQLTSTGWISSIFGGISSLLNIQIFPGVTIGIIVGIPFVISLAYFVIRAFRGGGGA